MKKFSKVFTTAIIAASMVMSVACGSSEQELSKNDPEKTFTASNDSTAIEVAESAAEESTQSLYEAAMEASSNASMEASEDASVEDNARNYERGVIEGQTYTNESLGVTIEVPSEWTFLTDEQLQELSGVAKEQFDNEEMTQAMDQVGSLMDMYAANPATGDNVSLTVEKKTVLSQLLDGKGYIKTAQTSLQSTLEASGFENVVLKEGTVETANGELPCLYVSSTFNGNDVNQILAVYSNSKYFVSIASTCYNKDEAAEIFKSVTIAE